MPDAGLRRKSPDVFQNAVTFLRKYDKRGVLLDLGSQIDAGNPRLDNFRAGVTYCKGQVETRRWYGFWGYGDIMRTYDAALHVWRYDVGGYAWDNPEPSPDLWLWYAYLRSDRAGILRFAEAVTRHTGEAGVHHLGTWAGLGTACSTSPAAPSSSASPTPPAGASPASSPPTNVWAT